MKKSGRWTYLDEYKESLVISLAKIEGCRGLSLDYHGGVEQFQNAVNSVKYWCGDNNILEKSTMSYFW